MDGINEVQYDPHENVGYTGPVSYQEEYVDPYGGTHGYGHEGNPYDPGWHTPNGSFHKQSEDKVHLTTAEKALAGSIVVVFGLAVLLAVVHLSINFACENLTEELPISADDDGTLVEVGEGSCYRISEIPCSNNRKDKDCVAHSCRGFTASLAMTIIAMLLSLIVICLTTAAFIVGKNLKKFYPHHTTRIVGFVAFFFFIVSWITSLISLEAGWPCVADNSVRVRWSKYLKLTAGFWLLVVASIFSTIGIILCAFLQKQTPNNNEAAPGRPSSHRNPSHHSHPDINDPRAKYAADDNDGVVRKNKLPKPSFAR